MLLCCNFKLFHEICCNFKLFNEIYLTIREQYLKAHIFDDFPVFSNYQWEVHVGRSRLTEMVGSMCFFKFSAQTIKFVLNHCCNNFNSLSIFSFIITSMEPFFCDDSFRNFHTS